MRTTAPLLLSLAVAATARHADDAAAAGGIRATRVATKKTRRRAAAAASAAASARPSRDHAARARRSGRRALANSVHRTLFQKEDATAAATGEQAGNGGRRLGADRGGKAATEVRGDAATADAPTPDGDGARELKKAKAYGYKSAKGLYQPPRPAPSPDAGGDDRFDATDDYAYGKSAKAYGDYDYDGDAKSGKANNMYSGKSGKAGGYSGSGKSGKAGEYGGGRQCHRGYAYVTVTNISYKQAFSEIFFMTAAEAITDVNPIYEFGQKANNALAELALNADPTELLRRYTDRAGVEQAKIYADFGTADSPEKYLNGGDSVTFAVATTGHGDRLSLAAGLPFTNDGFVALEGAALVDGAIHRLSPLDAGVEGNIQTCWSVPALQADFPPMAECADEDVADQNNNEIPGENYVGMHRGMQLVDSNDDLDSLLLFPECSDFDIDSSNDADASDRFAQYFYELGYNDENLLCGGEAVAAGCTYADDMDFLAFVKDSSIYDGSDDAAIGIALDSDDFGDFCDNIKDVNQDIEDLLVTLEPILFDWRNDVAHVKIHCEMDDDESDREDMLESEDDDYWP